MALLQAIARRGWLAALGAAAFVAAPSVAQIQTIDPNAGIDADLAQPGEWQRHFKGADAVVMQEHTEPGTDGTVRFTQPVRLGQNIRLRGEDIANGQTVLRAGTSLGPAALGVAAWVMRLFMGAAGLTTH